MKIIQVPFCYHPDPVGGTEVYVAALARNLSAGGHQMVIAAPADRSAAYMYDGIPIRRYALPTMQNLSDLYGSGDATSAEEFGRIVDDELPDLIHLHAFTAGVSLRLVREVKRRGVPLVFTYHTPTVSCQRGTLRRWGTEICDGYLNLDLCTRCTLQGLGMPRGVAELVGRVPARAGRAIGEIGGSGGLLTALRMRELVSMRHQSLRDLMAEVDQVIALCSWSTDLLLRNGLPRNKMMLSLHGLTQELRSEDRLAGCLPADHTPLRLAFLGRLAPEKGVDILLRALGHIPEARVELDLYGTVQEPGGTAYAEQLKSLSEHDPRISFADPAPNQEIVPLLRRYHALAVPSRFLETGPLVVLDAFAAGIAVIGSSVGGIAEMVTDGVNGLLVQSDDPRAWAQVIERLITDRPLLMRLQAGAPIPRTMADVAQEMLACYQSVLGLHSQTQPAATLGEGPG